MDNVSRFLVKLALLSYNFFWQPRLKDIIIWPGYDPLDGYICQSPVKGAPSPSEILSKYIGKPVHLTYKGPLPRAVDATYDFPDLKADAFFQDMYPMLLLSEESMEVINKETRPLVGTQNIHERWEDEKLTVERWVDLFRNQYERWKDNALRYKRMDGTDNCIHLFRFRPNIVFEGGGPFAEDKWEEISIGSPNGPTITLVSKCARCLVSEGVEAINLMQDLKCPTAS